MAKLPGPQLERVHGFSWRLERSIAPRTSLGWWRQFDNADNRGIPTFFVDAAVRPDA